MAKRRAARGLGNVSDFDLMGIREDLALARNAKSCRSRVELALDAFENSLVGRMEEAARARKAGKTPDLQRLRALSDEAARLITSCAGREAPPAAKRKR